MKNVVCILALVSSAACANAEAVSDVATEVVPSFNVEGADVAVDAGLTVDANEIAGVIDAANSWISDDSTTWTAIDYSRITIFVHADNAPALNVGPCHNCAGYTDTVKHAGAPDTFNIHVKQYYNCMGHSVLDHELLHALSSMNGSDGDGNHTSHHMWHELLETIHIHAETVCADNSIAPSAHTAGATN